MKRVQQYIERWESQGYSEGIPDEVPYELQRIGLAPSWKAIAVAILQNDMQFLSLGFNGTFSPWYSALKKIEFEGTKKQSPQMELLLDD